MERRSHLIGGLSTGQINDALIAVASKFGTALTALYLPRPDELLALLLMFSIRQISYEMSRM
jgi:hypothetical protein